MDTQPALELHHALHLLHGCCVQLQHPTLTGKDGCGLGDAGQALRQQLGGQVVQVQVNVVLLGAHAAALRAWLGWCKCDADASGRR